ncbi:hypothetical protein N7517_004710 [Penicillium concentricum]|uniref:Uncharacterized protein n=1 Tax=Penicillium concentricum TaxID=293559 RepID=A0A9W9S821_9EURO|nr:uncharacterized protein N7517_004710 [Penicillium concentricum]KAJ5372704.1 hypothetical protein N7517_004710 [Penicillium concentricum]
MLPAIVLMFASRSRSTPLATYVVSLDTAPDSLLCDMALSLLGPKADHLVDKFYDAHFKPPQNRSIGKVAVRRSV